MVQTITESHLPQYVRGTLAACFGIDAGVDERKLDVAQAVGARKKIKGLKNKTDLAIPNCRQVIVGHDRNVPAIEFVTPRTRRIQAAEHVHKSRFAAATWSHNCEVLVTVNLQR